MSDTYARVSAAAHSGAFGINEMQLPTAEQCRAGNYLKGRTALHGMQIVIEVPQGQRRMGKTDGTPWSTILMAHYGYLAATKGADGDALDIFVGPVPESLRVWVVNQISQDGAFDEHKILLGFIDEETARAAYMNSYERGWTGLGSLVACSIDQLKWWVAYGNTTIPLTERALPHDGTQDMNEIVWDSVTAEPTGCDMADLIYRVRREDGEGLMLDAVTMAEIMETSEGEEVLDALVVEYVKVERKAAQLLKIMTSIGGDVTPVSVQVTPPFKQRGTTNVVMLFELSDGQTVSIWFHNPDSTPNRILPQDELVSWSWRLNKKDVSILVAPEKGQDLNPREVARRIMKLAQRNSARFGKANATRAQRMASIEGLKGDVSAKEAALAALDALFNDLSERVEAKRAFVPATLQGNDQSEIPQPVVEPVATVAAAPAVVQPQVPVDRLAWEELVYEAIEARDISRSDAQSIVEAQGVKIDELFAAGSSPEEAASAFVGNPSPDALPADPFAAVDAALTALGFKRVQTNDWASPAYPQEGSTKGFNVRASGDPAQYRLSFRVTFPGITGASQDIGTFANIDALVAAVTEAINGAAAASVQAVDSPVPDVAAAALAELQAQAAATGDDAEQTAAKAFLQSVIDGAVDFYDPDLVTKLELIHDSYTDSEEVMALFSLAAHAFSDYMVEQTQAVM